MSMEEFWLITGGKMAKENLNLSVIKKLHFDAGKYSNIAITKDWIDCDWRAMYFSNSFFDKLYNYDKFIETASKFMDEGSEDTYFSINSFRRKKKQTCRLWHLNGFVLDFDYYRLPKYKELSPKEMYEKHIKDKLPFVPTAAIDSGRGLYILYSFKHASKGAYKVYQSIYNTFLTMFEEFGMDSKAMNGTQIIRVPGTLNTKSWTYVEVIEFNDTNYKLEDFFSLLPYTLAQTKEYKKTIKIKVLNKIILTSEQEEKRYYNRRQQADTIFKDFEVLIRERNNNEFLTGYREQLIYLARRRVKQYNGTLEEELNIAYHLNSLFKSPLEEKEVRTICKPFGNYKCETIATIIKKLEITDNEQRKLMVLKSKQLKDIQYQKTKRKVKLLNITKSEQKMMKRRTLVCELKNKGYRNARVADILQVNRSTITRDLKYINQNKWKFKKRLENIIRELQDYIDTLFFARQVTYEEQKAFLEWLECSEKLLI